MPGIQRAFNHYLSKSDGKVFKVEFEIDLDRLYDQLARRVIESRTGKAVLLDGIISAKGAPLKGQS